LLLAHRAFEPAVVVIARRGNNASPRSSSFRRRAIADARSMRGDPDMELNERIMLLVAPVIALSAISRSLLGEDTGSRVRWNYHSQATCQE
jgi:hypothetical protein